MPFAGGDTSLILAADADAVRVVHEQLAIAQRGRVCFRLPQRAEAAAAGRVKQIHHQRITVYELAAAVRLHAVRHDQTLGRRAGGDANNFGFGPADRGDAKRGGRSKLNQSSRVCAELKRHANGCRKVAVLKIPLAGNRRKAAPRRPDQTQSQDKGPATTDPKVHPPLFGEWLVFSNPAFRKRARKCRAQPFSMHA